VAKIDMQTGATLNPIRLPTLQGSPAAWAFSHWGGDFWIFLQRQGEPSTTVWHLEPALGNRLTAAVPSSGMTIVGAGVSTCAPLTTP
jgi:hypothetical protein